MGATLALGFGLGILVGGVITAAAMTVTHHDVAGLVVPAPAAVASPAASVAPAHVSGPPGPAITALSGTAVVNGRIALDATTLRATLATRGAATIELARALRSLAADAALGRDLVDRLAPWPEAAAVEVRLDDFYGSMAGTATTALQASLTDALAYRRAGREMMSLLAGLGDVDAASRTLAATVDLDLAPVTLPDSKGRPAASPVATP